MKNRIAKWRRSNVWSTFWGVSWSLAAYEAVHALVDLLV